MLNIDSQGRALHPRIKLRIVTGLQRGRMGTVHGIVVHQTGGSTAESAIMGYKTRPAGTHFLIDKDGTIYQTASLLFYTNHVGILKPRCVVEHRCTPVEMARYVKWNPRGHSQSEAAKEFPQRYPKNQDSIGIEIVGEFNAKSRSYVRVTALENASLKWLIGELAATLQVCLSEVYRHPQLSYKEDTEAKTAQW